MLFSTVTNAKVVAKPLALDFLTFCFTSFSIIMCFCSKSTNVRNLFICSTNFFFSKSGLFVTYLVFKTNPLVSILFTLTTNLLWTVF